MCIIIVIHHQSHSFRFRPILVVVIIVSIIRLVTFGCHYKFDIFKVEIWTHPVLT